MQDQTYWVIICIYRVIQVACSDVKSLRSTILSQWLSMFLTQWTRLGSFESCCLGASPKDVDLIGWVWGAAWTSGSALGPESSSPVCVDTGSQSWREGLRNG